MKESAGRHHGGCGGFTLAELLIVVAIIGVLMGVAMPVLGSQLEKSREGVDGANIRSQYSEVMIASIAEGGAVTLEGDPITLKQNRDGWQNSGLKTAVENLFQEIEGDGGPEPKAGGTAHVKWSDGKIILVYGVSSGGGDLSKTEQLQSTGQQMTNTINDKNLSPDFIWPERGWSVGTVSSLGKAIVSNAGNAPLRAALQEMGYAEEAEKYYLVAAGIEGMPELKNHLAAASGASAKYSVGTYKCVTQTKEKVDSLTNGTTYEAIQYLVAECKASGKTEYLVLGVREASLTLTDNGKVNKGATYDFSPALWTPVPVN